MKIKASLILNAVSILKTLDTTAMKLSTSYKVKTILNACQFGIEDFEAKRIKMAETHGTLSEDGSHYEFTKKGSQEAFQKDLNEMLDDDIDISFQKIPLALIDDYLVIAPANIKFVEWFIEGLDG